MKTTTLWQGRHGLDGCWLGYVHIVLTRTGRHKAFQVQRYNFSHWTSLECDNQPKVEAYDLTMWFKLSRPPGLAEFWWARVMCTSRPLVSLARGPSLYCARFSHKYLYLTFYQILQPSTTACIRIPYPYHRAQRFVQLNCHRLYGRSLYQPHARHFWALG